MKYESDEIADPIEELEWENEEKDSLIDKIMDLTDKYDFADLDEESIEKLEIIYKNLEYLRASKIKNKIDGEIKSDIVIKQKGNKESKNYPVCIFFKKVQLYPREIFPSIYHVILFEQLLMLGLFYKKRDGESEFYREIWRLCERTLLKRYTVEKMIRHFEEHGLITTSNKGKSNRRYFKIHYTEISERFPELKIPSNMILNTKEGQQTDYVYGIKFFRLLRYRFKLLKDVNYIILFEYLLMIDSVFKAKGKSKFFHSVKEFSKRTGISKNKVRKVLNFFEERMKIIECERKEYDTGKYYSVNYKKMIKFFPLLVSKPESEKDFWLFKFRQRKLYDKAGVCIS